MPIQLRYFSKQRRPSIPCGSLVRCTSSPVVFTVGREIPVLRTDHRPHRMGRRSGFSRSLVAIVLFQRILVIVQMKPEELALEAKFGDAYRDYTRRVNRWIGWNRP